MTDVDSAKAALLKLVEDAVQQKPVTKEDAIELFHKIQLAIGPWIVSELPPLEQKAVLVGMWALETVHTKCLPWLQRR
jgi:hypothetical protein